MSSSQENPTNALYPHRKRMRSNSTNENMENNRHTITGYNYLGNQTLQEAIDSSNDHNVVETTPPEMDSSPPSLINWPEPDKSLPVELFAQIASYLPFSEWRKLRLVDREFNSKMTEVVFQNTTLLYHPDLVTPATELNIRLVNLGNHFPRFAFSSEVSALDLLRAPIVSPQSIVKSWWGVYRWPTPTPPPSMYSALEESCQDPSGLAVALCNLTRATSLGIRLDSGLGYLCPSKERTTSHPPIFHGDRNKIRSSTLADRPSTALGKDAHGNEYSMIRKMFVDADFRTDDEVAEGMRLLSLQEGNTIADLDVGEETQMVASSQAPEPQNMIQLEESQMWMLLQSHRAHRSLLSCLSEALPRAPNFTANLHHLRISRLSSSLVPVLSAHSFWESLSGINRLFLGVVPDWRRIVSLVEDRTGVQVDHTIAPVSALGPVFDLLNDYVAPREKISFVHFEWVCGGEFARGGSQLNRYILPAPLAKSVEDIFLPSSDVQGANLLVLPHVRTLSLKNGWSTPHVLHHSILSMNRSQLRHLELESISLSGPTRPLDPAHPASTLSHAVKDIVQSGRMAVPFRILSDKPPPCERAPGPDLKDLLAPALDQYYAHISAFALMGPPPRSYRPLLRPMVLDYRNIGSWPHFINFFTPCRTIADFKDIHESDHDTQEISEPARPSTHPQLLDMSFKSCGYVYIPDGRIDNRPVLPQFAYSNISTLLLLQRHKNMPNKPVDAVPPNLQTPAQEELLGEIIRYLNPDEAITLERVFGLRQTWHGVYPSRTIGNAYLRGGMPWREVGGGRFSGVISAEDEKRMNFVQVIDYEA